jgi:hypothetical protein
MRTTLSHCWRKTSAFLRRNAERSKVSGQADVFWETRRWREPISAAFTRSPENGSNNETSVNLVSGPSWSEVAPKAGEELHLGGSGPPTRRGKMERDRLTEGRRKPDEVPVLILDVRTALREIALRKPGWGVRKTEAR